MEAKETVDQGLQRLSLVQARLLPQDSKGLVFSTVSPKLSISCPGNSSNMQTKRFKQALRDVLEVRVLEWRTLIPQGHTGGAVQPTPDYKSTPGVTESA